MPERKPVRRLDAAALLQYALKALSVRAHSTSELRQKLLRRAESPDDIPGVVAKLKEYGYLDDRQFAALFAQTRVENRGHGRARVLNDLKKRRVAPSLAEKTVAETFKGVDEEQMVEQYLARKYRQVSLPAYLAEEKHLASAYRRLRQAGFSSGVSARVLMRHAKQADLLDRLQSAEADGAAPVEE